MELFAIIAVVAAIVSGIFFIGALIWALTNFFKSKEDATPTHVVLSHYQEGGNSPAGTSNYYPQNNPSTMSNTGIQTSQYYKKEEQYSQSYDTPDEDFFVPQKAKGFAAASETSEISGQDFYKISGYEFDADMHDSDEKLKGESEKKILPQVILADGKMPTIEKRERPQKRVLPESTRCNICLGYIKTGLPLITCVCSKNYHISCASRVEECPMCHHDMLDYDDSGLCEKAKEKEGSDSLHEKAAKTDVADTLSEKAVKWDDTASLDEKAVGTDDTETEDDNNVELEIEEVITDEGEKLEDKIDILDKEQMTRLKLLLERYDLNTDDSLKTSLGMMRKKNGD